MNACWVPQLHAAPQHIPQVPRRREGGVCGPKAARAGGFLPLSGHILCSVPGKTGSRSAETHSEAGGQKQDLGRAALSRTGRVRAAPGPQGSSTTWEAREAPRAPAGDKCPATGRAPALLTAVMGKGPPAPLLFEPWIQSGRHSLLPYAHSAGERHTEKGEKGHPTNPRTQVLVKS